MWGPKRYKVHLYVPKEGNAPGANVVVKLFGIPAVGDIIHTSQLSPVAGPGASDGALDPNVAVELAERFRALDEWLSKGGFLPEAWATRTT